MPKDIEGEIPSVGDRVCFIYRCWDTVSLKIGHIIKINMETVEIEFKDSEWNWSKETNSHSIETVKVMTETHSKFCILTM